MLIAKILKQIGINWQNIYKNLYPEILKILKKNQVERHAQKEGDFRVWMWHTNWAKIQWSLY